jgi:hypothetical protein
MARLTAFSNKCCPTILGEVGNSRSFGQGVNFPTKSSAANERPLKNINHETIHGRISADRTKTRAEFSTLAVAVCMWCTCESIEQNSLA